MFVAAAMTQQGTRSVQALIEACRQEDMLRSIVEAIAPHTKELSEDVNGNHVIAQLLKVTQSPICTPLLEEIRKHCVEVGAGRGCEVALQVEVRLLGGEQVSGHAEGLRVPQAAHLRDRVGHRRDHPPRVRQLRDPGGRFVRRATQHLIKMSPPSESQKYCQYVLGNICAFSTDMCSSNVVELSIESGDDATRRKIIDEMLSNGDFDKIFQNRYGKYVVNKALLMTTGPLKERLERAVERCSRLARDESYEAQPPMNYRKF